MNKIRNKNSILSLTAAVVIAGALFAVPASSYNLAFADTKKAFPSVHLINEKGEWTDMKRYEYRATDGRIVHDPNFDASNWYLNAQPTLTIKMENIYKLRVAQDSTLKIVAKQAGFNQNGIEETLEYGANDDWDNFSKMTAISSQPNAYKLTYLLNQHNPCFSDESFQFPASSSHIVQVYAKVYFTDSGTWAKYAAQVKVIGAVASDNPTTTGC